MKERIYVCHTFYNVYVTMLKEFALPKERHGKASIVLSTMSTQFGNLKENLEKSGVFQEVYEMDEKKDIFFPELEKYKKNYHSLLHHTFNRIIFTKKLPKLLEPYISNVDFKQYKDIYVYCDSDPIGYYMNYKHIHYHAMEDGLDCLKYLDGARYDNRSHFGFKAFLSKLNLIFIQNGYGKYCLDMEINDRSCLKYDCPKYKVVPRKPLEQRLTKEERSIILHTFMEDADRFIEKLGQKVTGDCVLFLTQPHPKDPEIRKQICHDIIRDYCVGCHVVIKPHPRDLIDYEALRPDCTVINGKFPVEVLNFIEGIHFKKVISIVTTAIDTIDFADEKINLGEDFWNNYEDPEIHKYNSKI